MKIYSISAVEYVLVVPSSLRGVRGGKKGGNSLVSPGGGVLIKYYHIQKAAA